ncbi:STAS domain-containing protein [Streptomyces collinus]|uniref:STAS domain-containing protein n=1 Tax=Streptomyces collinus TaxID=42684 RepID=UPI003635F059
MPSPRHTPQDEPADVAPGGDEESAWPSRTQAAGSSSRLAVRHEPGGSLPPRLVLHLAGELDADTAPGLREDLTVLAAGSDGGVLTLDLSGITFCDVPGLYTLLALRRTLPLAGVEVVFTSASTVLRTASDRAGLTSDLALGDIP